MVCSNGREPQPVRGLSLPEILAVVAIIAILAGLAVANFRTSDGERRLEVTARNLFLDLQWARSAANTSGNRVYLLLDSSQNRLRWRIWMEAGGGALALDLAADSLLRTTTGEATVRLGLPGPAPPQGALPVAVANGWLDLGGAPPDNCVQGAATGAAVWSNGIAFCGGATADLENGAVFLSTSRSSVLVHALMYRETNRLNLQHWQWKGSTWERL